MANDLINHVYITKPPLKPLNYGVPRISRLVRVLRHWQVAQPERAWKVHSPSSIPCPMHLFHLAVPELYLL